MTATNPLIEGLRNAMLAGDGGFIDEDSEIPAGEMVRLAIEYIESVTFVDKFAVSSAPGAPEAVWEDRFSTYEEAQEWIDWHHFDYPVVIKRQIYSDNWAVV